MATIPQYEAPDRQLTGSDKGASAFEQAGRRTGPAYNEAATLTRQAGEAEIEGIKSRKWAFDMLDLEKSIEAPKGLKNLTGNGGVDFKVEGGVGGSGKGSGGGGSGGGHDGGARGKAAAGLSQVAAAMARGNQYRSQTIDTASGLDINDPKLKPQRYTKTLEDGQLVTYDKLTGQTSKLKPGPNAAAQAEANDAATYSQKEWADPANKKINDQFQRKYGYDPSNGDISDRVDKTGVQPGAGGDFNRDPLNPSRPTPLNPDGSSSSSSSSDYTPGEATDYGAMQQSMAPGAVNDVANTVNDMQQTFNTGPSNAESGGSSMDPGGGGDPSGDSGAASGLDFGGGGDET